MQLEALQGSRRGILERRAHRTRGNGRQTDALCGFAQMQPPVCGQLDQPPDERCQLFLQQAGGQCAGHALQNHQGLQFFPR